MKITLEELKECLRKEKDNNGIVLFDSGIDSVGAEIISRWIKKNDSWSYLNLWHNNIGDLGAKYIAIALEKNNSLINLTLKSNKIGALGAKYLATALEKNNSLVDLSLCVNNIGDEGLKYIVAALEKNITLTSLDIRGNGIREENKSLAETFINRNKKIHEDIYKSFSKVLNKNTNTIFRIEELKLFAYKQSLYKCKYNNSPNDFLKKCHLFSKDELDVINEYINNNFFSLSCISKEMKIKNTGKYLPKDVLNIIVSYLPNIPIALEECNFYKV